MPRRSGECLIRNDIINYTSYHRYNLESSGYAFLRRQYEEVPEQICCFYDNYPIEGETIGLPKKIIDGVFHVWGYFCSCECARSFIHENSSMCNQTKETSLLSLMAIKKYGINFRVNRAPHKFLLKKFGGPLDIDAWRNENNSNRLWTIRSVAHERTSLAYETFLDHASDNMIRCAFSTNQNANSQRATRDEDGSKKESDFHLSKRKTPAHFTKKSLLSLVQKN